MPRNLDTALAAELAKGSVRPFYLCDLRLRSGWQHVWSGVGPLVWNGNTYSGLGELAAVGPIAESSGVQADGMTLTLNVAPSQLAIPPGPITPPSPPYAVPAGQSVAWSYATVPPLHVTLDIPPDVYNDFHGCSGAGGGDRTSGSVSVTNGDVFMDPIAIQWRGFARPLEIPPGARIVAVYPVLTAITSNPGDGAQFLGASPGGSFAPVGSLFVAGDVGTWAGLSVNASVQTTLAGSTGHNYLEVAGLGLAVYYEGSPLTVTSLLYEALSDVMVGAPVKVWFGMLSAAGAIVGQPFLAYSGLMDEPSIDDDPLGERGSPGIKIVLAIENRLRNLQRASGRRYTAADQKLEFPNDSGFNFVEILEEISLKWGS